MRSSGTARADNWLIRFPAGLVVHVSHHRFPPRLQLLQEARFLNEQKDKELTLVFTSPRTSPSACADVDMHPSHPGGNSAPASVPLPCTYAPHPGPAFPSTKQDLSWIRRAGVLTPILPPAGRMTLPLTLELSCCSFCICIWG